MGNQLRAFAAIAGIAALILCACTESPPVEPPHNPGVPAGNPDATVGTVPGRVTRIALGDFFSLQQSGQVLVYDVRPAFFYSLGHIPGAINWPISTYSKQLASREVEIRKAVDAGNPVVLYCTDLACPDARNMATWLAARGHHIRVLEGGWDAWKSGGLPGT
ncbi:MAG: rhodanese-like domain-containing protein [Luteolibacter sp.]